MHKKTLLITWATWYIGSHMWVSLLEQWYQVVGIDTCERSDKGVLARIETITKQSVDFYPVSLHETKQLQELMQRYDVDLVIHFAWYKAVWESCEHPWLYLENNVWWTISLLRAMEHAWVQTMIFSSSATVYDTSYPAPYDETMPIWSPTNPYWASKLYIEQIIETRTRFSPLSVVSLRYFNPVWAHHSAMLGEGIRYSVFSLTSAVMQTLLWTRQQLELFGDDRPTEDGTCLRDFITIWDLISGHTAALNYLYTNKSPVHHQTINLWTWQWVSVRELLQYVKQATGREIPYRVVGRRPWDVGVVYASAQKAKDLLWWEAPWSLVDALAAQRAFVQQYCVE